MQKILDYIKKAHQNHFAIAQFNVSVLEEVRAAALSAQECNAPVIIGVSEGERKFMNPKVASAIVKTWSSATDMPLFLNADHTHSVALIGEALNAGFEMVHFDGSALDYDENLKQTKVSVAMARAHNALVSVEGELGYLRGGSALHGKVTILPEDLTDPDQALKFAEASGVDLLAVAVGNIHGIDSETGQKDVLDMKRIEAISKTTGRPLVLHGASDVSDDQIAKAIESGICKININSALRMTYVSTLKGILNSSNEITLYKVLDPVVSALKEVMVQKIKLFGSSNMA